MKTEYTYDHNSESTQSHLTLQLYGVLAFQLD